MKIKYWRLLVVLSGVIFFSPGGPVAVEAAAGLPVSRLQGLLNRTVSDAGIPGAVMAVQTPQGAWIGTAGKANLGTGQPMTADMQVRLASITKPFTATLIMKLMEEGKLALDDTIEKWLPGQVTGGVKITIQMLLNHTSGLFDPSNSDPNFTQYSWPTYPYKIWTSPDFLAHVNSQPIQGQGTYHYTNSGYYILGMIAEAAAGNPKDADPLAAMIQSRFFGPLNMGRTALTRGGFKTAPFTLDYSWLGSPYTETSDTSGWDLSWDWTAGSGVTTAADMLTWTQALFGGRVVRPETLNQMLTMTVPIDNTGALYGLGLVVCQRHPTFKERSIGHAGCNPGTHTEWDYLPDSQRTIFIALNRSDRPQPTDPVQVDDFKIMNSLIVGVANILNPSWSMPGINTLLLED